MNLCFTETIKDYPGYLITRDCRVLSIARKSRNGKNLKGKILKQSNCLGYKIIQLNNGKKKMLRVHRLLAIAFIPNPKNLPEVNHKNGNKSDNRIENLEWATKSENSKHSYYVLNNRNGWLSPNRAKRKSSRKVKQIQNGEVIKIWDSITLASKVGFTQGLISLACQGKRNHHKGFKWEYV